MHLLMLSRSAVAGYRWALSANAAITMLLLLLLLCCYYAMFHHAIMLPLLCNVLSCYYATMLYNNTGGRSLLTLPLLFFCYTTMLPLPFFNYTTMLPSLFFYNAMQVSTLCCCDGAFAHCAVLCWQLGALVVQFARCSTMFPYSQVCT